jgi:hypothetical protein
MRGIDADLAVFPFQTKVAKLFGVEAITVATH